MAKTLTMTASVHLSANFGGLEQHGETVRDLKKGEVVEIQNETLAALLVERSLAAELVVKK
jgi:hypothetical protein